MGEALPDPGPRMRRREGAAIERSSWRNVRLPMPLREVVTDVAGGGGARGVEGLGGRWGEVRGMRLLE